MQMIKVPLQVFTKSEGEKIFKQDRCIGYSNLPNSSVANAYCPTSESQLTGIEFSYVAFIYIRPETDNSALGWKGIFWKGYEHRHFPLLGPGVFVSSNNDANGAPTLRVVMNTYDRWFNALDVNQIPFKKWFHLAIVLRKNTLEIYINGNLANKQTFNGTLPYQNYQPVSVFPEVSTGFFDMTQFDNTRTESGGGVGYKFGIPPGDNFVYNGAFSGKISNMFYYSYALTYSEIMANMNLGPNPKSDESGEDLPPYLIDSWWTQTRS